MHENRRKPIFLERFSKLHPDVFFLSPLVKAIMPTLLIVQVGLERAVRESEEQAHTTDSDIEMKSEFVARPRPTSVVLDTVIITMDTAPSPTRSMPQSEVVAMGEAPTLERSE